MHTLPLPTSPPTLPPTLYTFRRCPYAIRARMAVAVSGVSVLAVEVALRDKPAALLACSPKGTVPVLHFADGTVVEESLDIMRWALRQHDPEAWLGGRDELTPVAVSLIAENDGDFKRALDRYKYAGRYPEHPAIFYREQGEIFLSKLNDRLTAHAYLLGNDISVADIAIFPFVRQFAEVDRVWFDSSPYSALQKWLAQRLASPLFLKVMEK